MPVKYQYFDGKKFTRDEKTGYYLNSTIKERMHRYVWEYYNGKIPAGYEIHHKDHDKSNNDISNLEIMLKSNHSSLHCKEMVNKDPEKTREHLREIRPLANAWLGSEEGRAHARQNYELVKDKFTETHICRCEVCGKEFTGHRASKFCSNACKSKHRRDSGADKVERVCVICGKPFFVNKYRETVTCGPSCRSTYAYSNRA